jgi:SP family arabinose:H+ symporter-like MFS transporter
MFGAEVVPALFLLVTLFFVSESPRWLLQTGQEPSARRILEKIGGTGFAQTEVSAIQHADSRESGKLIELFGSQFRRPLIIAVALMAFSQLSGINAIMYYSNKIFTTAGVGVKDSFAATTLIGLVNLLFTLVAVALVDKIGRRILLLVGLAAQVIFLDFAA